MEPSEKRIIGSLLLLLGLSILAAGLSSGQLDYLMDFLKKIFEPAVAGAP